jgi:hypothetical protein
MRVSGAVTPFRTSVPGRTSRGATWYALISEGGLAGGEREPPLFLLMGLRTTRSHPSVNGRRNPDAHSTRELDLTHWGVEMARKGGVPASRALNCLTLQNITLVWRHEGYGRRLNNAARTGS